jgi:hypothetical protein
MYNPAPPPPEPNASTQSEDARPNQPPHKSTVFLVAAISCQCLSFLATFLPWTTFVGTRFAGYKEFSPVPLNYDGTAGRLNLIVGGALFLLSFVRLLGRPIKPSVSVYRFMLIGWNGPLSIWLFLLYRDLSHNLIADYGMPVAIGLSAAVAISALISEWTAP